ncbi:MAG TPA: FAD-dependent oxidoreductase [Mucilaginibacter sp.]|jgi:hypothetical protein
MIKKLVVILLISNCSLLYAQSVKTNVLVIGGNPSGIAAAMQCAHSKVKTILVAQSASVCDFKINGITSVDANRNIPSGIWGEFRKHVQDLYKSTAGYDTAYNAPLKFEPGIGASILKKMTDTIKNLTIYVNAPFTAIKKDGDRWEVSFIQNKKTIIIKTSVVIDATETGEVTSKANAKFPSYNYKENSKLKIYRTSIASGEALPGQLSADAIAPGNNYPPFPAYCVPMSAVVVKGAENILLTEKALPGDKNIQYLPLQLELGQGVGAIAAYCAFFKTTTKNLKVRTIQGELLDFKTYLLPFADIQQKDPDWRAIQQISSTGLLMGIQQITGHNARFLFRPDSLVSTSEVQPVLTEIYTRAFLWFNKEKTSERFTIGNLLSFISDYTLTDPLVLKIRIQRDWKTKYKFKTDFDPNRQVTRREFAVLTNKYLNPFARTVDLNGRLMN